MSRVRSPPMESGPEISWTERSELWDRPDIQNDLYNLAVISFILGFYEFSDVVSVLR